VAQRREHRLERQGKDDIALRTPKGQTSSMKYWKSPECKIRIKDPDTSWQLLLKIERTSEGINWKASRLESVKRAGEIFYGLRKVTD
jgi:hypothetical protein